MWMRVEMIKPEFRSRWEAVDSGGSTIGGSETIGGGAAVVGAGSICDENTEARGSATARGELTTDVAIVGTGVAGLSTALHLHDRGIETIVLEAEQPDSAATGASGGILAPDFARNGIARAVRLYGKARAERLACLIGDSATFTFDLISRFRIECDARQTGFVSPGQSTREIDMLQSDGETWQSLGFAVNFLNERDTAEAIGTPIYRGALHFDSGGALNPLAYATGLANVLHNAGVPVFTNSPVRKVERDGKTWRVMLRNSRVRANRECRTASFTAQRDNAAPGLRVCDAAIVR